jgi:hypothetical protein
MESILLNIARASSSWAPQERIVDLGNASGSALECAACLDIFVPHFVAHFVAYASSHALSFCLTPPPRFSYRLPHARTLA